MKKILLAFVMSGMMFGTLLYASVTVSAENDVNFAIEEVTYEPDPPKKGESITFSVKVSLEYWGRNVHIGLWFDGERDPMLYLGVADENSEYAYCDIEIEWPDDSNEYTVKIMVDPPKPGIPDGTIPETNEEDNTWESTLKATKSKNHPFIDFLEGLLDKFDWPFPMLRVLLLAMSR
jgi:hypothetical protein